jgi:hypothetical protein
MKSLMKVSISLLLAFAIGNCTTISNSLDSASASLSKSMSDALNSISGSASSLSRSSKGTADEATRYESDVEVLVSLSAQNEDQISHLDKDLQRIAYRNGIVDWKEYRGTYTSIGSGLKMAGYSKSEFQTVLAPFENRPEIRSAILEGYGI